MADLQYKLKFTTASGSTTKTIDIPKDDATDAQIKAFGAAMGSLLDSYEAVKQQKLVYTDLDAE